MSNQYIEKPPIQKSVQDLVKDLDKIFSHFIRLRDVKEQDLGNGYVSCCTCGFTANWLKLQNGHFIDRKVYSVRWNEKNCNTQCKGCNKFKQGNPRPYREYLVKKYGVAEVEKLELAERLPSKLDRFSLTVKIAEYKEKVAKLKKELGL